MNKFTSFFEDLFKVLAALSLTLILIGYVDLKTYYRYFGVNISGYISSAEIIQASLDNMTLLLFSLFVQLIIWLYFFHYLFEWTEEDVVKHWEGKIRPKPPSDDLTMIRFMSSNSLLICAVCLFVPGIIFMVLKTLFPSNSFLRTTSLFLFLNIFLFMCIFMGGLVVTKLLLTIAQKQRRYHPRLLVAVAIFLPSLLFTTYVKNQIFVGNYIRKYGNKEKITIILQNDRVVTPNDSIRYIGKTENYFFYWNKHNWVSTIFPSSQIKEVIVLKP